MSKLKYPEVPEHILADPGALFVWLLMLGESQGDIGAAGNPSLPNQSLMYMAQDSDGEWYGYKDKPYIPSSDMAFKTLCNESWNGANSKFLARTAPLLRWKETLREVPHEPT